MFKTTDDLKKSLELVLGVGVMVTHPCTWT
jgi:hypothetical protein